jgi:hypothetical protein
MKHETWNIETEAWKHVMKHEADDLWNMKHGNMKHETWHMKHETYETWNMKHETWSMKHIAWNMK